MKGMFERGRLVEEREKRGVVKEVTTIISEEQMRGKNFITCVLEDAKQFFACMHNNTFCTDLQLTSASITKNGNKSV